MVDGLLVMHLVDGDRGMYDMWLDRLFLNNWLDRLVHMVVDVLASAYRRRVFGMFLLSSVLNILELRGFGRETLFHALVVAMVEFFVLHGFHLVVMFLREDLAVVDGLHAGVMMFLVDFSIHSGLLVMVSCWGGMLVRDSWLVMLVHRGVMVTSLGGKVLDRGLGCVHCVECIMYWRHRLRWDGD
jgi:hypothetical protein